MNIPQEEQALRKLTPQKYTIRILVIAVVALFTGYPAIWLWSNNVIKAKDKELQQCQASKIKLSEDIRVETQKYDRERADKAEQDRRRSDSVVMILTLTQNAVKKAIKNEKK